MNPLRTRILVTAFTSLTVAGIAMVVAWDSVGPEPKIRRKQWQTQQALDEIQKMIPAFLEKQGKLPNRLEDLQSLGLTYAMRADEQGMLVDGWERPFLYFVDGTNYVATSLGRDGVAGSSGLDADLSRPPPHSREPTPTFLQFVFQCPTENMLATCLFAGFLSGCLCWAYAKPPLAHPNQWRVLMLKIWSPASAPSLPRPCLSLSTSPTDTEPCGFAISPTRSS